MKNKTIKLQPSRAYPKQVTGSCQYCPRGNKISENKIEPGMH